MSGRWRHSASESGAALVSVLLIVSIMSVTAILILESISMASRISINVADRKQSRLYAIGAEAFVAASLAESLALEAQPRQQVISEYLDRPIQLPVEGGLIRISVQDGANCFNLNALVKQAAPGRYEAAPEHIVMFAALLESLEIQQSEAENLAIAVADWIDSDDTPGFGGAEDAYYGSLSVPYRTPGQFLVDTSELHLVRGFTPELLGMLAPFICLRQTDQLIPLNVNTLTDDKLILLAAYLGDEVDRFEAEEILSERPVGGYVDPANIFEVPALAPLTFPLEIQERVDIKSTYYDMSARVDFRDTVVQMQSALSIEGSQQVVTQSRRFGAP